MSDRFTKVTLTAEVNGYLANIKRAEDATRKLGGAGDDAAAKLEEQNQAMSEIGTGLAAFGAIAAVAVGIAVARFAEFDEAMSNVKAATQESAANMGLLREAALEAGASTVFSATEAANAIEELGKAGLTTEQIINGGLDGALSLAAAGQLSVADAANIAAVAVKQFNLEGSDVPHVADLLAAGAGKAVGSVDQLAQALGQAGLVANGSGQSIEDTTGVLAAFADAGLVGSDAGTSLKAAIIALQAPTDKARGIMEQYGLTFYDTNGQMLSFDKIAGQLQSKLGNLDDETRNAALAQIFGNDALRVANVLYDEGAAGISKYIDQTNDAGYASKVAADRLDNLNGDLEKLGGALDTALIKSGSGANDILRTLAQTATLLVDAFGSLPEPVLAAGLGLTAIVATVGLVGGAALIAVPKVAQFRLALATLNVSASGAARGIGLASGALAIAGIALAVWASQQAEAAAKTASYASTIESGTNAITKSTREMAKEALAAKNSFLWMEQDSAFDAAKKLGISLDLVTDAATGSVPALKELQKQIAEGSDGSLAYANSAADIEQAVAGESGSIEKAIEMTKQKAAADEGATESSQSAADAYSESADAAADLTSQISDLIAKINEANGVGQDAVSANANYQAALAGIGEEVQKQKDAYTELNGSLDGFTLSLDETTVAGSGNAAMLADVAGKAQDAALAQLELESKTIGSKAATDNYMGTLANQRQAFIDSAIASGFNADQVQVLADKVFALPSEREVKILADAAAAQGVIDRFIYSNDGRTITLNVDTVRRNTVSNDGGPGGFATGGRLPGPPSRTDNMFIHAASGEFVVNAAATQRNLALLEAINNGSIRGYANGGEVRGYSNQAAQVNVGAPSVQVFIGNEEVTGRVRVVVKDEMSQVARSARLGGGR